MTTAFDPASLPATHKLWCYDCQDEADPACYGAGGDEHLGTTAYQSASGKWWVVDETGRYFFFSLEPGGPRHSAQPFEPSWDMEGLAYAGTSWVHGKPSEYSDGCIFRRYTEVKIG